MFGGIEAGGTKFVCAVSDDELNIIKKVVLKRQHQKKQWLR